MGISFTVTVIIPVLNEELELAACLASCRTAGVHEVIVVDGGSHDGTLAIATQADKVLHTTPGRGPQQNLGAQAATGDVLLFLHADSRLPVDAVAAINECLNANPQVVAGCFWQQIDHSAAKYRTLERGNAWRVRWLGWMYGDQGIFVRRNTFEAMGGFPDLPLMEDLALSKRIKRYGQRVLLPQQLQISARRWERVGVTQQTLRNWLFILLFHMGVSAHTLARWYAHIRSR